MNKSIVSLVSTVVMGCILTFVGCGGGGGNSSTTTTTTVTSTSTSTIAQGGNGPYVPVADAGINQLVSTGSTVTLDGSGSYDADGETISYVWTMVEVPTGSQSSLAGDTSSSPSFITDLEGDYRIQLIVNDGTSDSASDIVTVTASNVPGGGSNPNQTAVTIKVYVAGESVEERNHFNTPPFNADGTLFDRGADNNTPNEFGWMVPFAARLKLRDSNLSVEWVGSTCWNDPSVDGCSTGLYTNSSIGSTSSISGTTVEAWLNDRQDELIGKQFCYDIAFASRGGNDLNSGLSEQEFETNLRELIELLDQGSNCRTHPFIYVTAHMLDVSGGGDTSFYDDYDGESYISTWMATQKSYYVTRVQKVVNEMSGANQAMNLRFIDQWTPFYENRATTAFPAENWWTTINYDQYTGELNGAIPTGPSRPDLIKIHRGEFGSFQHPRRLASIFAGENTANQINISELRTLLE
ncbi:MAG: PKD domain-containing protein [Proteobacteria bacterium]|nr:PKD domain-containing protein [Pseudomonadota bacterium]MBU1686633.1 PKD domain-containing protein [Pseudomonadota bacterium]